MTIEDLLKAVQKRDPKADLELIALAYDYAEKAHLGQKRLSGEDYIQHPLHTAWNLNELGLSDKIIAAGLLHDVPEDTERTLDDLKHEFGQEISSLVEGITKLGVLKYRGMERYVENLRKMFMAMAEDIRIILIKFADRMHNLKTLAALPQNKQKRIALETLEIYAPIANRLGMGELKGILEDLAFPYAFPDEYQELLKLTRPRFAEEERYIKTIKKVISIILKKAGARVLSIHGRAKHVYSLFRKLRRFENDLSQIHDIIALRIIVPEVADCYTVLGLIHERWNPVPGRIKDYIATPKPNGYQSLHTTIFCEDGKQVEFQIRTQEMHQNAEFGITSHWHYKEGKRFHLKNQLKKEYLWIKDLISLQKEIQDQTQFLESVKTDIFENRIFVFTPKGDVLDLPEGSTPVDFAYHIHTDVGNHCGGVKINEKIASLETVLKSGDLVEIIIDKKRKRPNLDWTEFAKTHLAREKIRHYALRANNKAKRIKNNYSDVFSARP